MMGQESNIPTLHAAGLTPESLVGQCPATLKGYLYPLYKKTTKSATPAHTRLIFEHLDQE